MKSPPRLPLGGPLTAPAPPPGHPRWRDGGDRCGIVLTPLAGSAAQARSLPPVNPADETIRLGPLAVRFLVTGRRTPAEASRLSSDCPGRRRLAAPAHSHDQYEETIYGIGGVLTWTVNGSPFDVGAGQALCIPRGAVHRFDNHGDVDVRALCVITPAAMGRCISASPPR